MNQPILSHPTPVQPLFNYLKKQQDNQKFIRYIEITATFILITFFLLFAIRPTVLTITSLMGEIESKKLMKKDLKNKINNIVMAQDQFSLVQGKYQIIDSSLPDRPRYYEAVEQIQKTSENSQTSTGEKYTFNLDSVGTTLSDPNLKLYTISLDLDGQFLSSVNQASKLLDNRRLINIDSITFQNSTSNEKQASTSAVTTNGIKTNFSTTFYYWPSTNEKK